MQFLSYASKPIDIVHLCIFFLNPNIQLIFIPFVSHTFSFVCAINSTFWIRYGSILFIIYIFLNSFLLYVHTNSILKPNPLIHEWFSGSNFFYPFYTSFVNIVFFYPGQTSKTIFIVLMCISAIFSLASVVYIIQKMPFILLFTNDLMATKYLCFTFYSVVAIIDITININIGAKAIIPLPIFFIIVLLIMKYIAEKKRENVHQLLSQIDSSFKSYSVDELSTALSSIVKSENTVQWVIKEGIISGNKSVVNREFLHFCLKKFRNSKWFISLISFIIEFNWEGDKSSAYSVLLHILSLQNSLTSSLQLFQCVYIMNQNSEYENSQIIQEDIFNYRASLRNFAEKHQKFWRSVMRNSYINKINYHKDSNIHQNDDVDDFRKFSKALKELYSSMREQKSLINLLIAKYNYSPSIQLYVSLYYSDIVQNYIKSGIHYKNAVFLRTNHDQFSSTEIFNHFSFLIPGIGKPILPDSNKNHINFMSIRTTHETALRSQPEMTLNDDFLESLCQVYSIPNDIAQHKILPFAAIKITTLKVVFVLLIIVNAYFLGNMQLQYTEFSTNKTKFLSYLGVISNTIKFGGHLTASSLDLRLLVNIVKDTYQVSDNNSISFYFFCS
ncbi:hypothetical protein TRFO_22779 [Tritrichomonas foetus]|uniref:Uncharacterized protein n=1 Tax=Tritrichomonas foetus TaxID=1144522 RepID=A0A1J4KAZ9_9EUKA|nr:hypothetical protein TRFO_22779 [Tritrichomonas foetus]|eukprot:OHT08599.1 hypothetical protein TRFO_22779 [Tritrichomonas foetus]